MALFQALISDHSRAHRRHRYGDGDQNSDIWIWILKSSRNDVAYFIPACGVEYSSKQVWSIWTFTVGHVTTRTKARPDQLTYGVWTEEDKLREQPTTQSFRGFNLWFYYYLIQNNVIQFAFSAVSCNIGLSIAIKGWQIKKHDFSVLNKREKIEVPYLQGFFFFFFNLNIYSLIHR